MADGQILIDTRIRTDEVKQDTANLKKQLESLADSASASAKKIDRSFDNISIDDAAEGLGESFEQEARKVEPIPEEIEKDFSKIDLEDVADGLGDGFEEEADKIKRESEKTETAVESLTDRISRQERELDSLKTAYVNARHEYGETADETQKLAREIEDLSGELAQSKKEFREAAKAADSLDKSLDDIDPPDKLGDFFGGIAAGLTVGALELLEEAGQAIFEFGKKSIGLASDLQEVQNVVDTAFPNMSREVEEFAQSAIKSAGLSETAAKKYLGTYGTMSESFGFTEKAAFDLSTTMVQLAGDVASFYNISADEAYTKLMAVFTGETEALKELGVIMTETELNAYAMKKGLDKGTQGMGKQEKAALRLEYTLDALSAAQGDFAKTSDSWANQTKILSENWNSFSASVGEGLINVLTPAVQFLNDTVMPLLQGIADRFSEMTLESAIFGDWITLVDAVGGKAEETAESVSQLTEEEQALAMATEEAAIALSSALEEMSAQYEAAAQAAYDSMLSQIGYFDEISDESGWTAGKIVENWKKQQEAFTRYNDNLKKAVEMNLPDKLVQQLSDGSQENMQILDALVNSVDVGMDEIIEAFESVDEARTDVAETTRDITTDIAQSFEGLAEQIAAEYNVAVDDVLGQLAELQGAVNGLYGKDIYINVITQSKTLTSGAVAGAIAGTGNLIPKARTIPYLASGAVIPPNAPFTAVLGDQKHGTNIEAPLATIQEAVAQVMGDLGPSTLAGFEAVVEKQNAILNAIQDIQIGDTTIGRAAARYDRRQNLIRGGTTG